MIKNKLHIARSMLMLLLTINFSISSIAFETIDRNGSCSLAEEKAGCCCSMESDETKMQCHSGFAEDASHNTLKSKDSLSMCDCYHGPDIDTDYLVQLDKVDHLKIVAPLNVVSFDYESDRGAMIDYSILDIRSNPPPIFLSISSFLI